MRYLIMFVLIIVLNDADRIDNKYCRPSSYVVITASRIVASSWLKAISALNRFKEFFIVFIF